MASIRKIQGKNGIAYQITVTNGRDSSGKQIRHYLTWTPPTKMTIRQTEKELQRVAFEFEQQIKLGFAPDNRQTLAESAPYVLRVKAQEGVKKRTLERYESLLERILPALGHLKLQDIRPAHLNAFYANLSEPGIRKSDGKATAIPLLKDAVAARGLSKAAIAATAGIAPSTVAKALNGETISENRAKLIADVLNQKIEDLFTIELDTRPLSSKTVLEYHRLLSTILGQAEKEMLVAYNAASKAAIPKKTKKEVKIFQPEEVSLIRDALEDVPIKWKTLAHLLLITGGRRGEIVGLRTDKIDWQRNRILIDHALLYTAKQGIYEDTTKTENIRTVALPQETMDLLRKYCAWRAEQKLKAGSYWQESGFLFVRDNGQPMHPDSITSWLNRFSEQRNLPHINPHKFRHTMASLLYYHKMDSVTISKRLGHAKVSTTTDIYSHLIEAADQQAGEDIAAAVFRSNSKAKHG